MRIKPNTKQQFALIQHDETYYLYSVSEKKFAVRASNGYIQFSDTPASYVTIEKTDNYFVINFEFAHNFVFHIELKNALYHQIGSLFFRQLESYISCFRLGVW